MRCKRHSGLSLVGCRAMTSCTDSSAVPPPRPGCASIRGWWATWRSGTIASCCTPRLHHCVRLDGAVDANVDLIEHASRRHLAAAHTLRRAGAVAQAFPEPFSMCGVAAEGWLTVPSVLALDEKAAFASATSSRKPRRCSRPPCPHPPPRPARCRHRSSARGRTRPALSHARRHRRSRTCTRFLSRATPRVGLCALFPCMKQLNGLTRNEG